MTLVFWRIISISLNYNILKVFLLNESKLEILINYSESIFFLISIVPDIVTNISVHQIELHHCFDILIEVKTNPKLSFIRAKMKEHCHKEKKIHQYHCLMLY